MDKPFGVVVNRYGIGNNGVENYCKEGNIDIIARIPNDRLIAETYSRGELLYPTIPSVKEALVSISKYIENINSWKEGHMMGQSK